MDRHSRHPMNYSETDGPEDLTKTVVCFRRLFRANNGHCICLDVDLEVAIRVRCLAHCDALCSSSIHPRPARVDAAIQRSPHGIKHSVAMRACVAVLIEKGEDRVMKSTLSKRERSGKPAATSESRIDISRASTPGASTNTPTSNPHISSPPHTQGTERT